MDHNNELQHIFYAPSRHLGEDILILSGWCISVFFLKV